LRPKAGKGLPVSASFRFFCAFFTSNGRTFAPFRSAATYRCRRSELERSDGRRVDAGADGRSVPGGLGPDQVLRASLEPREVVMLWVGMIAAIGLLVYLCVAMFDAENF
jgi:K+-transporting ATPase KdpF subunit